MTRRHTVVRSIPPGVISNLAWRPSGDAVGLEFAGARTFRDVYAGGYAALVEFSKRPDESGEDNPPTCALESARSAAAAYTYGVLSGRPESEALALAARFMKGKSLSGCRTPDDKPNLSWPKALQIVRANVKALATRP